MGDQNQKKTEECKHQWAPLTAQVKGKNVPTLLYVCLKCGEMKVGKKTIRISRFRLDMGGKAIKNLGAPSVDTDAPRARAGDILSGRFPMARMPDGAADSYLKGQGAGINPAYIAPPIPVADVPDLDAAKITTGTFPTARIADLAVTRVKLERELDRLLKVFLASPCGLARVARKAGADWDWIRMVAFSPDGKYLAAASYFADAVEIMH